MKPKYFLILNIIGAIILLFFMLFVESFFTDLINAILGISPDTASEAASIGIIGGADGPTAVFISGSCGGLNSYHYLYIPLFFIELVFIANIFFFSKNRKSGTTT